MAIITRPSWVTVLLCGDIHVSLCTRIILCGNNVPPIIFCWAANYMSRTPLSIWNRDSAVGIATGYRLHDRGGGVGVRVPLGLRIFSSPRRPERLWGPPNLLSNGYRRQFPRE
jgi:hypothetical protein